MASTARPAASVAKLERFFRVAAGLDVDKDDLKRYYDFVNRKLVDLLIRGQATAKANGRDVIQPFDLPVTKGLQERMREFERIDEEIGLRPALDRLAARRPIEFTLSDEAESRLPDIAGGISLALARVFTVIDPDIHNPQTEHWERSFRIFDSLL